MHGQRFDCNSASLSSAASWQMWMLPLHVSNQQGAK
jgi:hypothetical protein